MSESNVRRPVGRLRWIQVDCPDPERLAAFWADILGVEIDERLGDPPQYVTLTSAEPGAPPVSFQRVPEPKVTKNRLHFDILVENLDAACARVESLGGWRRDEHDFQFREDGLRWRRMADLEGNEFCLLYDA